MFHDELPRFFVFCLKSFIHYILISLERFLELKVGESAFIAVYLYVSAIAVKKLGVA